MAGKLSSKMLLGTSLAIAHLFSSAPVWSQKSESSPVTSAVSASPRAGLSQAPMPIENQPLQGGDKELWRLTPALREKMLQRQNEVESSARAPLSPCAIQNLDCSTSNGCPPLSCHLVVSFPETQWDICVKEAQYDDFLNNHQWKGLALGPVWLKRNATSAWMPILYEAEMAENFIAYHTYLFHFYDTQYGYFPQTQPMTPDDAGFGGLLLTLSQGPVPTAVAECRTRGLARFCHGQSSSVRRGEELVIWANYDTGNYDYIIEYGFRDDGTITFRVGASGFVNTDAPYDAHMHNVLWRVDMDLGGYPNDRASLIRHIEPSSQGLAFAEDRKLPWNTNNGNNGTEGFEDWSAPEFTTVLIEDVVQKNYFNHNIGYELQPLRHGTSKHFLAGELWSQHDFWVTRYHAAEETSWAVPFTTPDTYLMNSGTSFTSNLESTQNGDLVVWYHSAAHHDPIDEDRWSGDSNPFCKQNPNDLSCWHGVTSFHWQGFDLVPHNLFDSNPLGGPHYCYPSVYRDRALWQAVQSTTASCENFNGGPANGYPAPFGTVQTPYTTPGGTLVKTVGSPNVTLQYVDPGLVNSSGEFEFRDFAAGVRFTHAGSGTAYGFDYYTTDAGWTVTVGGSATPLTPGAPHFIGYLSTGGPLGPFILQGPTGAQGGLSIDNLCFSP